MDVQEVIDDLAPLLAPYGGVGGFWRLCADRPEVANALAPVIREVGAPEDAATIDGILAAHSEGHTINIEYADGRVDVVVPGISPN